MSAVAPSSTPWVAVGGRLLVTGIAALIVVAGTSVLVHGIAGVTCFQVAGVLRSLSSDRLALLGAVWFGGLIVYTQVLRAALPRLGMGRSLLVNLCGSAVANVLPLGGAVATGLNWRMIRHWGYSNAEFSAFCLLTNGLDIASKLLLPSVAVLALLGTAQSVPPLMFLVAGSCLVGGLAVTVGSFAVQRRRKGLGIVGRVCEVVAIAGRGCAASLRERPVSLSLGSIGYLAAQLWLLELCLRAVGVYAGLPVVLTALALERLASLFPLTPGGAGLAELGAVAWLMAAGVDPAGAVAGVLVYRVFVVGMEVPVGAVALAGWAWTNRSRAAVRG